MEAHPEIITPKPSNIHTSYEMLGDYRKSIPQYLEDTIAEQKAGRGMRHESSLYLNSSDSLEALMNLDLRGKKVLTVTGSGEFAQVFTYDGAAAVCCFDVSPASAFNSELRQNALCTLTMDDYIKLFGGWIIDRNRDETAKSIWKNEVYDKVEPRLTPQAKIYFSTLFTKPELIKFDPYSWNGFARVRYNKKTGTNRFVGDIIKKEREYKQLQSKAAKVEFTQTLCDVNGLDGLVASFNPDMLYISNIGYEPRRTFGIAKKYVEMGVPGVICTVSVNETEFNDTRGHHGWDGRFYYFERPLKLGERFAYEIFDDKADKYVDLNLQVVGMDRNADYGLVFKVTK